MITSFLVIFFFWVIFFFAEGNKKKYSPKTKKNTHQQTKLLIQRKHVYAYDISFLCPPPFYFFTSPPSLPTFYCLTTNENTLSTETRICLRNAVLLPPYSLCYFIKWGDKHNFSALHDLLSSTKKHFLCALTSHIKGIYFYNCICFKYPPFVIFLAPNQGGGFKEHVLKMVNLAY